MIRNSLTKSLVDVKFKKAGEEFTSDEDSAESEEESSQESDKEIEAPEEKETRKHEMEITPITWKDIPTSRRNFERFKAE